MQLRKDIPIEEFSLIISPPANRLSSMYVNIYADGRFNLNGKLIEKLGSRQLSIRFTQDGKHLCLIENGDIVFPKSGSTKLPDMIEQLKSTDITYPARYCITYSEATHSWQGTYEENPTKLPSGKARNTKKQSCNLTKNS